MTEEEKINKQATLKVPYRGYRNIILIEKVRFKWLVEISGPGTQIEVYEDEFTFKD